MMPGMNNLSAAPTAWVNALLGAASTGVKRYCKRDLELAAYDEPFDGHAQRDITLRQTGVSTWTWFTYTGTTATSFTGCTLGGPTGTMKASYGRGSVSAPVVFFDPAGYFGQTPNSFYNATSNQMQMVLGTQFVVVTDDTGGKSNRGLLRRIGGAGQGFIGFYPENFYSGKLGAYRLPVWPRGDGNIWVKYTAGYAPAGSGINPTVPDDIQWATAMLVAYMVRVMPSGSPLTSENLGSYSYNVLDKQSTDIPEIGSIARTLAPYRESSW